MSGSQVALDQGDLVPERQLPLLQPRQAQLIETGRAGQAVDHAVKVSVAPRAAGAGAP